MTRKKPTKKVSKKTPKRAPAYPELPLEEAMTAGVKSARTPRPAPEVYTLWRAVVDAVVPLPGEIASKALQRLVKERDAAKALGEAMRLEYETAIRERGMFRDERDAAIDERDALYDRLDEAHAERNQAIAERDALRERLKALDETIAMVEMPNIPWTASGNKDRQGRPARTGDEPDDGDRVAVALVSSHKFAMNRVKEKVRALIESMRGWSYCGDDLVDDPAIYVPLDALTDTLGMPRTPPVKERAPVEPVKVSTAGPVRPKPSRHGTEWLPGTPEHDPADPQRVEYVESITFTYGNDSAVRVTIETDELDGGTRRLSGHCYHSALVITSKELLDMACWAYEAETKNTADRVRREAKDLGARTGEKRYADGFNAGYDQGLADARKEMRDAQEGDT